MGLSRDVDAMNGTKAQILVADDEPANRELLEGLLATQGWHCVTAEDGRAALEVFGREQPDAVLLDVQMPFVDGFEVCRRLKQDPKTKLTPVILITALSATEDRIKGIDAGADDFLTKPIERAQLIARVRAALTLKAFTDELDNAESVLFALASSIEAKDPYTEGHCERLSQYAVRLGRQIGLPTEQVVALGRAGIVHDIGKVAVPEAILLKAGPLTATEYAVMKQHPIVGERICAPLKSFRLVQPIIRHHHERLDGSGYPDGLKGDSIPLTARILTVVDVFDALTTDRPYRAALSREDAFGIVHKEVGQGWWDPALVDQLDRLLRSTAESGEAT
jgi:putative two-component system response regulator